MIGGARSRPFIPSTRHRPVAARLSPIGDVMADMRPEEKSEDEISVGCPSPPKYDSDASEIHDDYFKPLKKLKMVQIDKVTYSISSSKKKKRQRRQSLESAETGTNGVKSFSILDILNHRPARESRIVRPWDEGGSCLPAHRGLLPPPPILYRPKSADMYETCSSGRSSTSECCTSPDIVPCGRQQQSRKPKDTSPLDALFQMTSKTFEELNGESGQGKFDSFVTSKLNTKIRLFYKCITKVTCGKRLLRLAVYVI